MNTKVSTFINSTKKFIGKNSPKILTGIGIAGMIGCTVSAVCSTPKALTLIEEAKEKKGDELTAVEVVKVAWKPYFPAMLLCTSSVVCLISATVISTKRNAALTAAYALSEKTLTRYKDKVIETIGERKEKEIRDSIAQDQINEKPLSSSQVIITPKGNTLCLDSISGRYFRSDLDTIRKAMIELNGELLKQNYMSLNEFYYKIGLDGTSIGDQIGWKVDGNYIDLEISACMAEDEPCVVISFSEKPKYDYDKFA